jgi:hyaluronoglucosaminidase
MLNCVNTNIKAGVIEGFFGAPWGWAARLGGAEFLRDSGYQFYIYAPKAEAFLRRRWREPLPAPTVQHLLQLAGRCRECGVSFGMGLTPFEIYLNYDSRARSALRSKVRQLNDIGVDMLCVLFDDMRGDIDGLADLQASVIMDVCAWSTAGSFIACPTYYSYDPRLASEFGPPPKAYLRDLGRLVDERIDFFWTGEKIISDGYSAEHLTDVAADIGRRPFIWDNHITNDARTRTDHLYLDPAAGSWGLPVDRVAGLAINPMNQPYLSRIALAGYRQLLTPGPKSEPRQALRGICMRLCGQPLAQRLLEDIDLLQESGLAKLDAAQRRTLLDFYGAETGSPYAQEIAAWLRGEYVFDPQCLTI